MSKIYIDADACPVKEEVYKVAIRNATQVLVVSNGGIRPHPHYLISLQIVADGLDVADDWIAERADPNDLVITSDIPLADKCIKNGATVIKPDGTKLDHSNIGSVLANRNLMTEMRSADPYYRGRGREFSKRDRANFLNVLETEIKRKIRLLKE